MGREEMYRHFRGTHQLFAEIFSGMDDPVAALYATLGSSWGHTPIFSPVDPSSWREDADPGMPYGAPT
jgi:hypothetical protein|eukprot:COSAG01_NODE_24660_length_771_cov_1.297619_2_plen_68_part_00